MAKLKLNLDDLEVESFQTTPNDDESGKGTVFGYQYTEVSACDITSCGQTCGFTCTCGNTCHNTCGLTCGHTCMQTCAATCDTCGNTCFC